MAGPENPAQLQEGTVPTQSAWRPSEYEAERFSLGRRAFNADESDCCACVDRCADRPQGEGLPICRALPLTEAGDRG